MDVAIEAGWLPAAISTDDPEQQKNIPPAAYVSVRRVRGTYVGRDTPIANGFLLSNGIFTTIDVPTALGDTFVSGINDEGDIVGSYGNSTGAHGFLLRNGRFITIDVPAAFGTETSLSGINNQGDIVGSYLKDPQNPLDGHGFLLSSD